MRQYTTPAQTAKLIELGFEKPKGWITIDFDDAMGDSPLESYFRSCLKK